MRVNVIRLLCGECCPLPPELLFVALVAATAALFLAITAMKSRNDSIAKVQGKDN